MKIPKKTTAFSLLPPRSLGFTFIELLIAISIMLIVLGGGIASYIDFNEKHKVTTSAHELQQLLRSAQVKARVGQRPTTCDKLLSYTVEGIAGGSTIQLIAQCEGTPTETIIQSLDLNSGVTLDDNLNVEYKTLHGGVSGDGEIQLNSTFGYTYTFSVDSGGAISLGAFLSDEEEENQPSPSASASVAPPTPSPSPSVAPTPSPSPSSSPTASPSPSPSPTPVVIANAATGQSCSTRCQAQGKSCQSIGTDASGTNGNYNVTSLFGSACIAFQGSCSTTMGNWEKMCDGNNASWVYCRCL